MATIRRLISGNWQAIVRRRGIKPTLKTFSTKADANRWARLIESEIERGVFLDRTEAERTTMAELIDRYLVEVTPAKKSAFLSGHQAALPSSCHLRTAHLPCHVTRQGNAPILHRYVQQMRKRVQFLEYGRASNA